VLQVSRPQVVSRAGPTLVRRDRRVAQLRRAQRRLPRFALLLLCSTWIPGIAGSALGSQALQSFGAFTGYAGLSWALPALLVGTYARLSSTRAPRLTGAVVGSTAAAVLLTGSATLIGT
jgi:hypothetical protein